MLQAGLDLSRRRLDVCLIGDAGEVVEHTAAAPDADGLRQFAERLRGERVRAVIESMTGARFVHDTLEELGWEVQHALAGFGKAPGDQHPLLRSVQADREKGRIKEQRSELDLVEVAALELLKALAQLGADARGGRL